MNAWTSLTTLATFLFVLQINTLSAQQVGLPDFNFGIKGKKRLQLGKTQSVDPVLAIQPDQRILIAGMTNQDTISGFLVQRVLPTGEIDTDYGDNGQLFVALDGNIADMLIQPDGKAVLVGHEFNGKNDDFVAIRLTNTGSLDLAFNAVGKKRLHFEGTEQASAVAIQADGRLLITGDTYDENWSDRNIAVARLNADGSADAGFGYRGRKIIDIAKYDHATDIIVQPDGKISLAASSRIGTFKEFVGIRLTENGKLDINFGEKGIFSHHVGREHDHCTGLAYAEDGGLLLAGHVKSGGTSRDFDFAVVALSQEGTLSEQFGTGGIQIIDAGGVEYASKLLIQPDGQLLVVGSSSGQFAVARISHRGYQDRAFGSLGISRIEMDGERPDFVSGAVLQQDGKLLIVGGIGSAAAIARLEGNPYLPGLEEVLAFDWEKGETNYGQLAFLNGLPLQAWLPDIAASPKVSPIARRAATKSLIPIQAAIQDHAYFSIGDAHKLTLVWDLRGGVHYYLNGIYKKTE